MTDESAAVQVSEEAAVRTLLALGTAALRQAGLGEQTAAFAAHLRGGAGLVRPGEADLTPLWGALLHDLRAPREQAGHVILLMMFHLQRKAEAEGHAISVMLPPPARQAVGMVLEGIRDLDAELARLSEAVAKELNLVVAAEVAAAMAAAEQAVAEEAAAPGAARTTGPQPAALAPASPTGPVSSPRLATGPGSSPTGPVSAPRLTATRRPRSPFAAVVAGVLLLGLGGYWGAYAYYHYYVLAAQLHIDTAPLSAVLPVRDARVNGPTLVVVAADERFAAMEPREQMRVGGNLLTALGRKGVFKLLVLVDKKQYRLERTGRSMRLVVPPTAQRKKK